MDERWVGICQNRDSERVWWAAASPDEVCIMQGCDCQPVFYLAITDEAITEAITTMQREMKSDPDAPYNEDMAHAIAGLYRAIGEDDEAEKWHRPQ